jgi:hypothetical protein
LNPAKGFEVARKGTNGFHAFVTRTGDDTFRGSWPFKAYRDDILYPISFDEAGAKENMRVFFDAAEMQAKGTPPEELKKMLAYIVAAITAAAANPTDARAITSPTRMLIG